MTARFDARTFAATFVEKGGEIAAIAQALGITKGYANVVRMRLGIPANPRPPAKGRSGAGKHLKPRAQKILRACMNCRKTFKSEGAHNRLCCPCKCGDSAQMMEGW